MPNYSVLINTKSLSNYYRIGIKEIVYHLVSFIKPDKILLGIHKFKTKPTKN